MELEQLLEKLNDFAKLKSELTVSVPVYTDLKKQYEPKLHKITEKLDKTIKVEEYDDSGAATGNLLTKIVPVAKLPISFQKKIVSIAVTTLCGNPVEYNAAYEEGSIEEDLISAIKKTWDDNKLDFHTKRILRHRMAECQCAELWYKDEADETYWADTAMENVKLKLRVKILAPSLGDSLFPIYNSVGDMIAFVRGIILDDESEQWEVYTADNTYYFQKGKSGFDLIESKPNELKKIPIIYYEQAKPEWDDVQPLIERLESLMSQHADTNDYTGSPIILASGSVKGFSAKGESGKVLELEDGATASYLEATTAPESIKLEMENLRSLVYDLTNTPDISFDQVKGLGAYSGIALKMIFLAAHMKASEHEETFGEGIQRRLNFIKAALLTIQPKFDQAKALVIKPRFTYFVPVNIQEEITTIKSAIDAGLLSNKSAMQLNPLVTDPDAEIDLIDGEAGTSTTDPAITPEVKNPPKPGTKPIPATDSKQQKTKPPAETDIPAEEPSVPIESGETIDISRVALTINYLSLTMERAKAAGDNALADKLSAKIDELLIRM
jgi:SPP1 family phage portal protein